jgi:hypothetical protein
MVIKIEYKPLGLLKLLGESRTKILNDLGKSGNIEFNDWQVE